MASHSAETCYAAAPFFWAFSSGLGPEPFKRTKCCSVSYQNGAPNKVAPAVISQSGPAGSAGCRVPHHAVSVTLYV